MKRYIALLLCLITVALRVGIGLFGNYLYLRTLLRKAKKVEDEEISPYDQEFHKSGGVSFALAIAPELLVLTLSYIVFFVLSVL